LGGSWALMEQKGYAIRGDQNTKVNVFHKSARKTRKSENLHGRRPCIEKFRDPQKGGEKDTKKFSKGRNVGIEGRGKGAPQDRGEEKKVV